jgi:hypothetical protein
MNIEIEGSKSNPTKLVIDGNEVAIDAGKWEKAYKTVKEDMGYSEDSEEFLPAVCEMYLSL